MSTPSVRAGSIAPPLTLRIRVNTPDISAFIRYERCLFVIFTGEEALRLGRDKFNREEVTLLDQRPPTPIAHYLAFSLEGEEASEAQRVIEKINRILSQPGTQFEREVRVTLYKVVHRTPAPAPTEWPGGIDEIDF